MMSTSSVEENTIHSDMDKLYMSSEITAFRGHNILMNLYYTHLLEKYQQNCFIHNLENARIYIYFPGTSYNVHDIRHSDIVINNVCECIENDIEIILIPIVLVFSIGIGAHENLLIYRKRYKTIDVFEPHGKYWENIKMRNWIKNAYSELEKNINKKLHPKYRVNVLQDEDNFCPVLKGLQYRESCSTLKKFSKEPGGYCAVWSLYFAELVLKNPTMTSREIMVSILKKIRMSRNQNDYLREIIRGYAVEIKKAIERQVQIISGRNISYDKIVDILNNKKNKTKEEQELLEIFESNFETLHALAVQVSHPNINIEKERINEILETMPPSWHSVLTDYRRTPNKEKQLENNEWGDKPITFPLYTNIKKKHNKTFKTKIPKISNTITKNNNNSVYVRKPKEDEYELKLNENKNENENDVSAEDVSIDLKENVPIRGGRISQRRRPTKNKRRLRKKTKKSRRPRKKK